MIELSALPDGDELVAEKAETLVPTITVRLERALTASIKTTVKMEDFTTYKYKIVRPNGNEMPFPRTLAGVDPLRSGIGDEMTADYFERVCYELGGRVVDPSISYDIEVMQEDIDDEHANGWKYVNGETTLRGALIMARAYEKKYPTDKFRVHISFPLHAEKEKY